MRAALAILMLSCACATPKTLVEIPDCADRVDVGGQARRLSAHRFELDHTFDFAFTKTELAFERDGDTIRKLEIWNNQPDPLRVVAGAAMGIIGGILLAGAVYDVQVLGRDLLEERPFYETLWGSGLLGIGVLAVGTGWHPTQKVIRFDGACEEESGPIER